MVLLVVRTEIPQDWFRDPTAAVRKRGERPVETEFSNMFKVHALDVEQTSGA
ncbi:hypothetical protein [Labrenzia sp. DG1229]|uniref:hypothetical protein n=1 Tax=Labrenzia sp. DG1229 TaxID=681847 RepID=UPI0012EB72EB|nr:hypothetical protein [Labrenzia sp. DG1229]